MEYALIQSGHKYIQVHASDYARNYSYSYNTSKPICPHCGTPLDFVNGNYKAAYFRHVKNSPIAQKTCDLYVSGLFSGGGSASSWNTAPDFLYYLEEIGESFQLYLALPKITVKEITSLRNRVEDNIEISYSNSDYGDFWIKLLTYPITALKADKHTLIPITKLALRYRISNISIKDLPSTWRSFGSVLPASGTLFHIYDDTNKHRSIADDGQIYLHTPYYLLISEYRIPKTKDSFLKIGPAHSINAQKMLNLKVYKIEFTKLSPDAYRFAEQLHVTLSDKPAEITLLWPPLLQENDLTDRFDKKIISYFSKINTDIYYALEKSGSALEPFVYDKFTITGREKTVKSPDDKTLVPTTFYIQDEGYPGYFTPALDITWNNSRIETTQEITLEKTKGKTDLEITSDIACSLSYSQNNFVKYIGTISLGKSFHMPDEVTPGDVFTIYHGKDIVTRLTVRFKRKQPDSDSDTQRKDLELYRLLRDKTDNYISYPIQLKHILSKFSTYRKSYPLLKQALIKGRITEKALNYMNHIMKIQVLKHG